MISNSRSIPFVLGECGQPLVESGRREAKTDSDRVWQRVAYGVTVVAAATTAFISLAAAHDVSNLVHESYLIGLSSLGFAF